MSDVAALPRDARVVIVGTGQAGFQVALSLREKGHTGPVVMVGEEPGLPYNRPPLSKTYITDRSEPDSNLLRAESFYESRDIAVHAGVRVAGIDRERGRVVLAGDGEVPFDHLVLATGSRPRTLPLPGQDLRGVVSLRTLADAENLRELLTTQHQSLVVIGGGFIGLEIAAAARSAGHTVTLVETADRLLARAVSPEIGAHVAAAHRRRGSRIMLRSSVRSIRGPGGQVSAVELADGEMVPANVVLVGVGGVPNNELATGAGLELCAVTGGILVDERLLTSDPRISAIGDCATYPNRFAGHYVRLESVQNAVDQARHVVNRLVLGVSGAYDKVPWFWTTQFDLKMQTAGLGHDDDDRVVLGDPAEGAFSVLRFHDGRLVAVESVNRPGDHMAARKLLDGPISPTPVEVRAPDFTLKSFLSVTA